MAKEKKEKMNYKNLKVNEEELSVTKIGELATASQSPIFLFVLFGLIFAFIFFLPTITNYLKEDKKNTTYETPNTNEKTEEPVLEPEEELTLYTISDSLSITLEDTIELKDFSLKDEVLSFQATNNGTSRFDFDAKNYFLELYTDDNTLLERILLDDIIARDSSITVNLSLEKSITNTAEKILFVQKEISDYPNITLSKNDLEEEVLVCSNDIETLSYKFKNEKLYEINDNVSVNSTNDDYTTLVNEWKTKSETLNNLEGITSVFVNTGTNFVVNTSIDLADAKISNTDSKYYFANQSLAKVVNFEMEARGFSCK